MIPILGNDIRTLLGKLGAWPCDFSQEVAIALYNMAVKNLPANGVAVDFTPSGGKSTVVLSAAAFRNGAKTVALIDKAVIQPVEELWFQRAHKTFKMKDVCTAAEKISGMAADMVVVRGDLELARNIYEGGLKPDGILFGINFDKIDGVVAEQAGNQWAVWRKPKAQYLPGNIQATIISEEDARKVVLSVPDGHMNGAAPASSEEKAIVITEAQARQIKEAVDG